MSTSRLVDLAGPVVAPPTGVKFYVKRAYVIPRGLYYPTKQQQQQQQQRYGRLVPTVKADKKRNLKLINCYGIIRKRIYNWEDFVLVIFGTFIFYIENALFSCDFIYTKLGEL